LLQTTSDTSGSGGDEQIEVEVQGANLAAKLAWIKENAQSNGTYIVTVDQDEQLAPQMLSYNDEYKYPMKITIQLNGTEEERTVSLLSSDYIFFVGSGVTLVLDGNITLQGKKDNGSPLVWVRGTLEMNKGVKIIGNSSSLYAGGVYVDYGTFTMNGGEISDNTTSSDSGYGGGVCVSAGVFTINDGKIYGNAVNGNAANNNGGGVCVPNGTFIMNNGEIYGNTAYRGGGVYMQNGTFTMNDGKISDNTGSYGGGVNIASGTFTMNSGKICGNNSVLNAGNGGGVTVSLTHNTATFNMNGGEIYGNSCPAGGGGGVYVRGCTFTMNGGKIYGNIAGSGGGVYLGSGVFRIITGTIYGTDEEKMEFQNTAINWGDALYKDSLASVQYGTLIAETWDGVDLTLSTSSIGYTTYIYTNDTINVIKGELVPLE
jgi:hypothetical protein